MMHITAMIQGQLQPSGIKDHAVIEAMSTVKREAFVPKEYASLAYSDAAIPLGHGQKLWTPLDCARVLQALAIEPHERVTILGVAGGYLGALAHHLSSEVLVVANHAEIVAILRETYARLHLNLQCIEADPWTMMLEPSDVIICASALPQVPTAWLKALKPQGRLFACVDEAIQTARVFQQNGQTIDLFETDYPWMLGAQKDAFIF